ncbi:hypothetical protein SNEBB_006604 [Seison nebaliae]|nr:hypothetical protein SNEBB_006604 [Seison nebaliae]
MVLKENKNSVKFQVGSTPRKNRRPLKECQINKVSKSSSNLITNYVQVRRSERRPKSVVENEEKCLLIEQIKRREFLTKTEEFGITIEMTTDKGRSIFSTKQFFPGEFVVEYVGDLIGANEANKRELEYSEKYEQDSPCFMYYFKYKSKVHCIDATSETKLIGRLINHSRLKANLQTKIFEIDGIPRLLLFAKRFIKRGEELLYDYGDRSKKSIEAYPWLLK